MSDDNRWRGFIDFIDEPLVVGWAFDTHNPNLPILVEIIATGGRRELVRADVFRQDLKDHDIGDGRHGFVLDLQNYSTLDGPVTIAIHGSDCVLIRDVRLNSLSLRSAVPPISESFRDLMTLTAAEVRDAVR